MYPIICEHIDQYQSIFRILVVAHCVLDENTAHMAGGFSLKEEVEGLKKGSLPQPIQSSLGRQQH